MGASVSQVPAWPSLQAASWNAVLVREPFRSSCCVDVALAGWILCMQKCGRDLEVAAMARRSGRSVQVCARSSKFSLFDPAKEMAYIQMSRKEKSKGKAAVDLIGSQVSILTSSVMLTHQYTM